MNLAGGLAAQLLDDAGMVGGVNLLGAGGGAEKAGGSVQPVFIGLGGKRGVLGVRVRLALKGGEQILDGDFVFRGDGWHYLPPWTRSKPTARRGPRCDGGYRPRTSCMRPMRKPCMKPLLECCAWKQSNTTCRKTGFRVSGTTSLPICPSRWRRRCIPARIKPIGPDDLAPLFPMSLILQEVSTEREIEIPEEVRQIYAQWRPSPLYPRAAA